MTDHGSIPLDSNLVISSLWWLELPTAAPLDSCWLQAVREDYLNCKPFSISARFYCHSSWDFFDLLLLHPTPLLTVKDYFPLLSLPIHSLLLYAEV